MIRHLAAIDQKRGLAKGGGIPWHAPRDVKRYRQLAFSDGATVLMGYRTYLQVVKHLDVCHAFVLSHHAGPLINATAIDDVNAFLDRTGTDVWIIGGASVFEQTLLRADELYLTEIEGDFDCDQFYPEYKDEFQLAQPSEPVHEEAIDYKFCVYRRK